MSDDVIIIGAGAAGLMCAIEAGKRGRRVRVLERGATVAEKIRISGGGRCNFTNLHAGPANYLSQNPHFCVSALKRYTQHDFIALLRRHAIAFHEKTLGQLFCDGSSLQIIDMLLAECRAAGVTIETGCRVTSVTRTADGFAVATNGDSHRATSLVVATGGPSIPKMGATGFGYDLARQFGLNVIAPLPALVPLTFDSTLLQQTAPLSGISVDAIVACGKARFAEAMLFTHRGLSGPAILQISSYWRAGMAITIDMAPGRDVLALLKAARTRQPKQNLHTILAEILPKRLAQHVCDSTGINGRLADLSDKKLGAVAAAVNAWQVTPVGSEGFRTAEVTLGGVDTAELSSKTFEARKVPGLYFIGEVVDVTGHLGGFNFQWAWASGHAAGQFV